eukprot:2266839-Pyramimonas_sp.AAC.1
MLNTYVENGPTSIREILAYVYNECARREEESRMLEAFRPPSVKPLPTSQFQGDKWQRSLRRNARPAFPTDPGVRHGGVFIRKSIGMASFG